MGQWLIWTRSLATRCPVSSWLARHLPSVWRWWSEEDGRTGAKLWMHSASDQEVEEECHVYMCWDFVSCVCFSVWLHVCCIAVSASTFMCISFVCLLCVLWNRLSPLLWCVCLFTYLFVYLCIFLIYGPVGFCSKSLQDCDGFMPTFPPLQNASVLRPVNIT